MFGTMPRLDMIYTTTKVIRLYDEGFKNLHMIPHVPPATLSFPQSWHDSFFDMFDEVTDAKYPQISDKSDEFTEALDGYILDPKLYPDNAAGLKTTKDGQFVLIPQPSEDQNDPLNWSRGKKIMIIVVLGYIASLADFVGGTTIVMVIPQAIEWNLSEATTQRAVYGCIFTIGACGLIVVALAAFFGRLPVTFLFQAIFFGTCAWSAAATSFDSYLTSRIVSGLFSSVGQGGSMMWIKDLYFFHDHPRVINYIEFAIITSPYLGPMIAAFIVSGTTWRWAFWLCTILVGISFLATPLLDETLYDRSVSVSRQPPRKSLVHRLFGIEQAQAWKQRSFTACMLRPIIAITKLPILLINIYYFLNFAWVIGVNATVSIWLTNYYGFTPRGIGFFYFFGIVGPFVGWLAGHWLHDIAGKRYAKSHGGHIHPEARLIIAYPATLVLCIVLVLLGFAIQYRWHYMVLAVLCALQCAAVMIVTTAVNAYLLDSYPEASGEVGAWISASRNWSGFMATFIQIQWVTSTGAVTALATQAGITIASMAILAFLQVYGKRLRRWQGRVVFRET